MKPKVLHSKGHQKQNKKTALRMGENLCKCSNLQGINLQNIQTFKQSAKYTKYAAEYQTEQNYPIKKMNRFK